ncbi:ABC transporter permease [Anaerocolumna jejuensis]|uniref:ABC transporter permease n=1 Tax=Anaerocolumna jejuensis TaxID=259063 RepID=UPI003F7BA86C
MGKKKIDKPILAGQIVLIIALFAAMEYTVSKGIINGLFLASPSQMAKELVKMIEQKLILKHTLATLWEFAAGYLLSVVTGILTGVLFVAFPRLNRFLSPFLSALMAIPKVAIFPLLIIWFGIGFTNKVVMIFLFCYFTIFVNTRSGAEQTSNNHIKVARIFKASKAQTIWKVLLPSAIPTIFAGLKVTAATGITGVIFAEMQASQEGLGYLLKDASSLYNTPRIFVVIIWVTILSVILVEIVGLIEKNLFMKWAKR